MVQCRLRLAEAQLTWLDNSTFFLEHSDGTSVVGTMRLGLPLLVSRLASGDALAGGSNDSRRFPERGPGGVHVLPRPGTQISATWP